MGKGKTRKFIDKKEGSVTFYLGHRSQKDPLIVDETAPQRVLIPFQQSGNKGEGQSSSKSEDQKTKVKSRKQEQVEYGVYFDDDYDYLQHLKDSQEVSNIEWDFKERIYAPTMTNPDEPKDANTSKKFKLKLPSSAFASEYEEEIGLLNKAVQTRGPRPDLDPDVMAALDDDFDLDDEENHLEDNFMELATGGGLAIKGDSEEDEEKDKLGDLPCNEFSSESEDGEMNTRFTNYSMSSSVVRRNEQLTLLDERFNKLFEDYDDTEIGALDCDEIEGYLNPQSDFVIKSVEKFEEDQNSEVNLRDKIERLVLRQEEEASNLNNSGESDDSDEDREKWDCASIISTYSTTKNRPKLIRESPLKSPIKIGGKHSIPVGVIGSRLTKERLKQLDSEYEFQHANSEPTAKSMISTLSAMRSRNETPEERHKRKKLLREYRQERRFERKVNTMAFKEEKKKQVKVRLNNVANVQGLME